MTDVENTNVENVDPTVETPVDKKEEKTFLQKDVDKIVQERVSREKTNAKRMVDDAVAEKTEMENRIKNYELVFKKIVDEQKKDFPEMYLPLLDNLSLAEQYAFLTDPKNKLQPKKQIPETKKTDENVNENKISNKKIKKFL